MCFYIILNSFSLTDLNNLQCDYFHALFSISFPLSKIFKFAYTCFIII